MLAVALSLLALAVAAAPDREGGHGESVQSILQEESPDVFLGRVTLQQYLERVARQEWGGVRRLTHPKALAAMAARRNRGEENLAPWDDGALETFSLKAARSAAPGIVLVEVAEHDDSATYVLFKSNGSWRVGAKEFGAHLGDTSAESIRSR